MMMSPETLPIDRTFPGVGRINKRSGTTSPVVRAKINRMLTALKEDGRLDILRAIRDDQLSMLQVYEAYQHRGLDKLPLGGLGQPLDQAFGDWLKSLRTPDDYSDDHIRSLGASRVVLNKHKLKGRKTILVADLPELLEQLRETVGRQYPRTFNLARSAALAFVRAKFKQSHPLWLAISAVEKRRVIPKMGKHPLTPDEMLEYFPTPHSDHADAIAWTMATTGMHQKELWGKWSVKPDRIHVGGTKRGARKRDIPLLLAPTVPRIHRRTFEDKLRDRTNRAITPYDLRRTYANWLEAAGIPRTRRRMYVGHGPKDTTDLYERHEVTAFLARDLARLRAYLLGFPGMAQILESPQRLKLLGT